MRSILRWILGLKDSGSGITAANRMKLMLVNDRFQMPPAIVEQLRQEFLSVASRYFDVDQESTECVIKSLGDRKAFISATVPLIGRISNNEQSNNQSTKSNRRNKTNLSSAASRANF